jgi:NitT/TauT family transport system substrate-binding protein
MLDGNSRFIEKYPAATKRVLRAYIRAAEHCAREPESVADFLVSDGLMPNAQYAQEMMGYLPYDVWRRFEPEATVRFYALRLYEAGVIKSTPEEIIDKGTDWTFLEQLKEELAHAPPPQEGRAFALNCEVAGPRGG